MRTRLSKVKRGLEVQPELRGSIQSLAEKPRGFRGDAPLAANKLIHPLGRNSDVACQLDLGDSEGDEEFLKKNLARVGRGAMGWDHGSACLVVVGYLDFEGVRSLPAEHNTPLIVYTDAVKAIQISDQGFQPVSGRRP